MTKGCLVTTLAPKEPVCSDPYGYSFISFWETEKAESTVRACMSNLPVDLKITLLPI